jgi:hypothetical protein
MWAKFGQKVGSMFMGKTPKNKMTIAKFKTKKKLNKVANKGKKLIKDQYEMARDYPLISLAAVGTGSVIGTGLGMGVNKLREKNGKKTRTIS